VSQNTDGVLARRFEVSADTSVEVADEAVVETEDPSTVRIRAEMKLSSAVRDYLEAKDKFEAASNKYGNSCEALRAVVKPNAKIVVRQTYGSTYGRHYLLTSDDKGNFEVKSIEVI
jgi:hypothetical protein